VVTSLILGSSSPVSSVLCRRERRRGGKIEIEALWCYHFA
jgi:hypothetical protein